MGRTPKIRVPRPKPGKVTSKKVHPLILDYLKSKGIPVQAVEVDETGKTAMIYNNALEETK